MGIYYLSYKVVPSKGNEHAETVASANAHIWVLDSDIDNVVHRAERYLSEYMWNVTSVREAPRLVTESDFATKDLGLLNYRKAQKYGIAVFFSGWAKDGQLGSDEQLFVKL